MFSSVSFFASVKMKKINQWEQAEAIYSELAIARELAPAFGRDPKADRGGGELYSGKKGMASGVS